MSLFAERQANSRKVIALENEILNLKQQLSRSPESQALQQAVQKANDVKANLLIEREGLEGEISSLNAQVLSLKSEMKKLKSENTRLKKKAAKNTEDGGS